MIMLGQISAKSSSAQQRMHLTLRLQGGQCVAPAAGISRTRGFEFFSAPKQSPRLVVATAGSVETRPHAGICAGRGR